MLMKAADVLTFQNRDAAELLVHAAFKYISTSLPADWEHATLTAYLVVFGIKPKALNMLGILVGFLLL